MTSMNFLINDSTSANSPVVRISITQNSNGTLSFSVTQLAGYVGDLRGLFFDVADASLVGSLTVVGIGTTDFQQSNNSIVDMGGGANLNGLLGQGLGYDVGIEIGTSGIRTDDDFRTYAFTLDSSQRDLTLADFSNVNFGVRVTSVGLDSNLDGVFETARSASSKSGEVTFAVITTVADTAAVMEDAIRTGNVLSNDGASAADTLSVQSWSGGSLGVAHSFSQLAGATVRLNTDGSYEVDATAADSIRAGIVVTHTFTYEVLQVNVDGTSTQTVSFTITITGTNDGPVLSDTTDPTAVSEAGDASAQNLDAITGSFSVSDLDVGDTLDASVVGGATVTLDGNAFTLPPGAAALIAAGAFTVTDTTSNGAAASIGYSYDPGAADLDFLRAGQSLSITYVVKVNDGTTDSATQNVSFTITGTNDGPVLSDTTDPTAVSEAGDASAQNLAAITGSFSVSDLDVGDALDASVVGDATVTLDGNAFTLPGSAAALIAASAFAVTDTTSNGAAASIGYSYDPGAADLDFLRANQSLSITYVVKVNDGTTDSVTQNVSFTITGTNDGPVLSDTTDPTAVSEAGDASAQNLAAITGSFSVSDLDVGDALDASVVGDATVTLDGNAFTLPGSAAALIAASAFAVTDTTSNGAAASIGYSYDPGAADLDFLRANQSLSITYVVKVNDGTTDSVTQNVSFTITGTNDGPVAANDSGSATEAGVAAGANASGNVLTNDSDVDNGDSKAVATVRSGAEAGSGTAGTLGTALAGAYGSLTLNADGSYSYAVDNANTDVNKLNASQSLTDNFTYAVSDGNGGTDQATLAITITGANDAPVAADDTGSATEAGVAAGANASGNVLTNDSDVDNGDSKAVATVRSGAEAGSGTAGTLGTALAGAYGSLTLNADGSYSYAVDNANTDVNKLNASQSLTDNFTYAVSDGNGGTDQATLAITITGANDAPVASAAVQAVNEDATVSGNVSATDADAGETATLTYALVGAAPTGLTFNANGTYSFDASSYDSLAAGQELELTVAFTATDAQAVTSASANLVITITGINDVPVIAGQTTGAVTEDTVTSTNGTLSISDPDAGQSSFQAQTGLQGTYGTLNVNAAGNWTYFLNNSLGAVQALNTGQMLSDSVNVLAADGTTQAIGITINGQTDATGFLGKQLTYQYVFPQQNSSYKSAYAFTTGAGVEIAAASQPYEAEYFQVDVSATSIVVTYISSVSWNGTQGIQFNGFKLTDVVNNVRNITGVSDNSAKAATSFDANNIYVDWKGQNFVAGESITINVTFGTTGNDPIVLDLDGDGVKFVAGPASVNFDLDADGAPESIAWASPQDGVLVMDLDSSGAIESGKEVLSENFDGFGFGNSVEALRSLDANIDGLVDIKDASFADLRIWRDFNGDGVSQAGELLELADLGIVAISTQEATIDEVIDGQHVYAAGTFFYGNGATGSFVGVQLSPPSLAELHEDIGGALVVGPPALMVDGVYLV